MAEDKVDNAPPRCLRLQHGMPGITGTRGNAGAGGEIGEGEQDSRNPHSGQSGDGGLGLAAGFGTQAVIDDECQNVTPLIAHPVPHQQGGGQTIRPAGDRHSHMRLRLERPKRGDQAGEFSRGNRQRGRKAQRQPAELRAAAA